MTSRERRTMREKSHAGALPPWRGSWAKPVRVGTVPVGAVAPGGGLRAVLGAEPGEARLVRAVGLLAAVVPAADHAALADAERRARAAPAPAIAARVGGMDAQRCGLVERGT